MRYEISCNQKAGHDGPLHEKTTFCLQPLATSLMIGKATNLSGVAIETVKIGNFSTN